ncbi:MAG: acetyl-CoA carboxylase biotin carboxyl carrier protein [Ginsengibacter sp.]
MDIKQIQELVKLINKSNIGELSIEKDDFKITIKQKKDAAAIVAPSPAYFQQALPAPAAPSAHHVAPAAEKIEAAAAAPKEDNYIVVKSPMIGTFYRQAGPDKPLFVNVGDQIEVGKVLCIIEAMKLFNEIESEVSGKIVKILVEDASPVEFDQPLFMVDPS